MYLGPREGNSWLSRLLQGTAGVVLAAANVALGTAITAATLGLAGPISVPLAVASVATGVAAVGMRAVMSAAFINEPTSPSLSYGSLAVPIGHVAILF